MKSLQTQLENVNTKIKKERDVLRLTKRNPADLSKFRTLQAERDSIMAQIADQQLINEVESNNLFELELVKAIEWLRGFRGDYLINSGKHSAKFTKFLETNPTSLSMYAKTMGRYIDIVFQGGHSRRHTIDTDKLQNGYTPNIVTVEAIKEARAKHNELLKELKDVQDRLSSNYYKATGNHGVCQGHHGKDYPF